MLEKNMHKEKIDSDRDRNSLMVNSKIDFLEFLHKVEYLITVKMHAIMKY